jgi:uncharacterized membrane protein HdeD (DUF308 family)
MLAVLVAKRRVLLFRGSLAVLFGLAMLAWPSPSLRAVAWCFAGYTLVDGTTVMLAARALRHEPGGGSFLFEGAVRIAAGVYVVLRPGITVNEMLVLMLIWTLMSGLAEIAEAVALSTEVSGEWPLPLAGAMSLVLAVAMVLSYAGGTLQLAPLLGAYGLLVGIPLASLAVRLYQLAEEMARA